MGFFIFLLLSVMIGLVIFKRQNSSERLGGPIAPAKALWLYWTIMIWFFLLPYTLITYEWQYSFLWGWSFLTLSMWIRGIAELYMLFVTKTWTPVIGISHDLITLLGVVICYLMYFNSFLFAAWWVQLFALALLLSLMVEVYYAWAFLKLVKEKTKGNKGIWYASKEDPQFLHILRVTTFFNIILYGCAIQFIYFWKFS